MRRVCVLTPRAAQPQSRAPAGLRNDRLSPNVPRSLSIAWPSSSPARSHGAAAQQSFGHYFLGQALGLLFGLPFIEWLFFKKAPAAAVAVLCRR